MNTVITMLFQIIQVLFGFAIRKLFIDTLGVSYLGYNSVFSNILQMLNLADMGIGVAITSFLYKPLVEQDEKKINALMYIYSRIYHIMGGVVTGVGILLLLFIPQLIPDAEHGDSYLRILFIINLVGTISTYFLAYKRTLLIAQQKSYLTTTIDSFFFILCSALQILVLFTAPNYITYLLLNVLKNVLSNIVTVFVCNKKNHYLSKKSVSKEDADEYQHMLIKHIKDLFISKIGAYVYYGTENIIISIFKGSLLAGFLSNYTMVTSTLHNIIVQVLASLQATYGHYISAEKNIDNQKKMTDNYFFMNYLVGNFCMVCILFLIQPFILLYFGSDYVLGNDIIILLSVNFLLKIMVQIPSQVLVVYKLYHYDYPIVIVSAILNIIIAVSLVGRFGISGVLTGTLVTSLIYLFARYYIISKHIFYCSYSKYILKISGYLGVTIITLMAAAGASAQFETTSWILFLAKGIIVGFISMLIPILLLFRSREWGYLSEKFLPKKLRSPKALFVAAMAMALIILFLLYWVKIANS